MEIRFLGTSHGYAEKDRFVSCTVIVAGGHYYLLDAGGPVEALMVRNDMDFADIRGIFLTHMHSDHVGSLTSVIEPFLRYRYNNKATCFFPEERGLNGFLAWMDTIYADPEKAKRTVAFRVTKPGALYADDCISVTAAPTRHMEHHGGKAFSYTFEADGKRVLFTGDMASGFPEYTSLFDG